MFRTLSVASFVAFVLTVLLVMDVLILKGGERDTAVEEMFFFRGNRTVISSRKLLQSADDGVMNRIGMACSKDDIVIYQGPVEFLCTHSSNHKHVCQLLQHSKHSPSLWMVRLSKFDKPDSVS